MVLIRLMSLPRTFNFEGLHRLFIHFASGSDTLRGTKPSHMTTTTMDKMMFNAQVGGGCIEFEFGETRRRRGVRI